MRVLQELVDETTHSPVSEPRSFYQHHSRLVLLQHEIAALANRSTSFEAVLRQTLPQICTAFGWQAAHAFVIAEGELILLPTDVWHFEERESLSRLAQVRAESVSCNPSEDVAVRSFEASNAPRAVLARELGLSHTIDLTVLAGPYPGALIEFFSSAEPDLDEEEQEALRNIASHLGHVLERQRYVSALLKSEAKFRSLFECNAVPMYFWNSDKLVLDANDALLRLVGFTREEVARGELCCADITPREQWDRDAQAIEQLRQTGTCEPYEKNWVRRDGKVLSVVLGGTLLPGSNDMGTAVAIDVTELRQAAGSLRESERRYQLATSAASVSIWEWDLQSGIIFSDGVLSALLGYPKDESVPHDVWVSRIHAADRSRVLLHEQLVVASHERLPDGSTPIPPIEFRIRNKHGRAHWFLNRGLLLRNLDGHPYRATGAITDITDQKSVQQALHTKQQQLQAAYDRVRTLTGRLITTQEKERTRVAREIHDDLGQRLAALGISLANIRRHFTGSDELFARAEKDVDDLAKAIRELSHNLHSAVLEHAGLEAALKSLADEQNRLGRLEVTLKVGNGPRTLSREVSLAAYRIAQEAMRNVQKHAGPAQATIYLDATDSTLLIQVSDNGRGFDPALRRDRAGLGLISAQERARLLGGRCWVTSSPGNGARISAVLPLRRRRSK